LSAITSEEGMSGGEKWFGPYSWSRILWGDQKVRVLVTLLWFQPHIKGGNDFSHSNVERFEDKVCLHDAYSMFEERAWTAHDQVALTTYRSFPMASHSPDRYHRI